MKQVNFDEFKCRCSAIHSIMSNGRTYGGITEKQLAELDELEKKEKLTTKQQEKLAELLLKKDSEPKVELSETCLTYLMEWYSWEVFGKAPVDKEAMYIQYCEKGKDVEEDSITLLSLVEGEFYQKNEDRICNDFLTGIPDVYKGDQLIGATKITDIKSAWDLPGFLNKTRKKLTVANDYQVKGYMDITGSPEGEIANCLVNMPLRIMDDLRRSLLRKMNVISEESPEFIQAWEIIERSCIFDEIPIQQRVHRIKIEPFLEEQKLKLYDKVKYCREWLWKFDEEYKKINTETPMVDVNELTLHV